MVGLAERVSGKWHAALSLLSFARYLRNYREFFEAYRTGRPLPPLEFRGGMTLHHDATDDTVNLFREIFVDRCYTKDGFYSPSPGDTVLDLGANIGFFAMFLQWMAPGLRVHCFEPASNTRERLERNIRSNHLEGAVTIHPLAVSGESGVVRLKVARLAAQRSIFSSEFVAEGNDEEEVGCVSLDRAVEMAGVDRVQLLKIDIEGAEIEAMTSASAETWSRVERVTAEYHDRIRPGCRQAVYDVLKAQGFHRITEPIKSPLEGMGTVHATRH